MKFTIFTADCKGNAKNCHYPHGTEITGEAEFAAAVTHDYVCARYKNSYRSNENFIGADCLPVDCDNDHSDEPSDWITPEKVAEAFPGVAFAVHYSRNNMREKYKRAPRPKFHILFPIPYTTDAKLYAEMKKAVNAYFPYFDTQALDAARFFYGTDEAHIEIHDGDVSVTEFLETAPAHYQDNNAQYRASDVITEGSRNSTLSRFAGRVLKRYGICDKALNIFMRKAEKCDPPLDDAELNSIWVSACKFAERVQRQEGYIPPEQYDGFSTRAPSLKPADYSDIGQARVLASEYADELIHTDATDMLRYNGVYWEESKQYAIGAVIEFLDLQLEDANDEVSRTLEELVASGVQEVDISVGSKRFEKSLAGEQEKLYAAYVSAVTYRNFVMRRRDMKYIASTLATVKPMVHRQIADIDADPYLLNTPTYTIDLRKGVDGAREHDPDDHITKVTAFDPSDKGKELWLSALREFFCSDDELIEYVQQMMGLATLGKVYVEALIIAYGDGGNGKSTFGNAILKCLNTYSGSISADALTVSCKRNVKPELAEAKGKRLLIAAELEEGMRLNTSMVKQLCSTDVIEAEKKYKDPFHYVPSHSLLLYTNHLPRVGAMDEGIWRRLIVIPFNAKIQPKNDIKNYADYLVENAGEYIIKWLVEGAEKIIRAGFNITLPDAVEDALRKYKRDNDWLSHFIEDCCETDLAFEEQSGKLYDAYRAYCARVGEYTRNSAEFYASIEQRGLKRIHRRNGRFVLGLRLIEKDFTD